jgi:hypothetical protein
MHTLRFFFLLFGISTRVGERVESDGGFGGKTQVVLKTLSPHTSKHISTCSKTHSNNNNNNRKKERKKEEH